ncbi:hypothetical protein Gogos_005416, partial [Gossypium gossypioides]|nr:hypothetical protein [Gossypium gossypioides]
MFLPFVGRFSVTTIAMKIVHKMQKMSFMSITSATILMATLIIILHVITSLGELRMLDKILQHSDMGIYLLKVIIIQNKGITINNSRTIISTL